MHHVWVPTGLSHRCDLIRKRALHVVQRVVDGNQVQSTSKAKVTHKSSTKATTMVCTSIHRWDISQSLLLAVISSLTNNQIVRAFAFLVSLPERLGGMVDRLLD